MCLPLLFKDAVVSQEEKAMWSPLAWFVIGSMFTMIAFILKFSWNWITTSSSCQY